MLGLSGGIDSALVAMLAVRRARAPERVTLAVMPSPYSSRRHAGGRPRDRREPRHRAPRAADRADRWRPTTRSLAEAFAGREPDITEENLQARIRGNLRDGAVEQVRLAGADDRQQVRAVGRLRDALRRHGRRLRGAQGRLQGLGLPARALAQRAGGGASWCRAVGPRAAAVGRAAATTSATRTRCRPTRCSTRSSRATSRRTSTPPSWCARGLRRGGRGARDHAGRPSPSTSAARRRRASRSRPGLRPRPAAADHEPLPRRVAEPERPTRALGAASGRHSAGPPSSPASMAHRRPWSSVKSTSQTQVVRPRWSAAASACTVPSVTGRRKLVVLLTGPSPSCRRRATAT